MKNFLIITSLLVLVSCTSNTIYKAPEDLIPKDSMSILIQEMIIASSSKNVKNINLQKKINYLPFVYDRFKIDSNRFDRSNFYYTSKVDDYLEILKDVEDKLKLRKKHYSKLKTLKDSIRKDSLDKLKGKRPLKKADSIKYKVVKPIPLEKPIRKQFKN